MIIFIVASLTSPVISALYRTLGQKVLKFILKRNGGDLEVAETVLQDTFVAVIKSFHTFHNKSTYFTWICKIALNKLADYYRQQVHTRSRIVVPAIDQLNTVVDPRLSPEEQLSLDDLRSRVNQCLDLLPPEYRRLLHLRYYQDLSLKEISLRLNLPGRSLEGKLYRAKKALAQIYGQSESGTAPPKSR